MRMVAFLVFSLMLSIGLARAEDNAKIVQGIIKQQIEAFRSDDGETAYSFAAPGIKSAFPDTQRFMEMVKNRYGPIYRPGNLTFGRNASEGDGRLMIQELLITDTKGKSWQAVYILARQDDGTYRITGVRLTPIRDSAI
ncbi:DUF4864 domain-containing protein [Hoeflea sp. CAU 1731]